MSHTTHELAADFPEFTDKISDLKQNDAHFARLASTYEDVNSQVYKAEQNLTPMDSLAEADLRKQRAALKDEIWGLLKG